MATGPADLVVTLQSRILEALVSNLSQDVGYSDRGFFFILA
jgi:hypothetical protein